VSTIRCIYDEEPTFPATDQHPDAKRYKVGGRWVDALGGKPTLAEIDAVLNPPAAQALDPVEKLKAFLAANPDVQELVK
jgi:hypothetical protein